MRALRPDLQLEVLRGNVDTRLRKVSEGVVDAALLACAGLDRLGHGEKITSRLDMESMLPAIGQGALALEARAGDERVRGLTQALSDPTAEATVAAERALLAGLGGSCRTPLAGHALLLRPDRMLVRALVGAPRRQRDPAGAGGGSAPRRRSRWVRSWPSSCARGARIGSWRSWVRESASGAVGGRCACGGDREDRRPLTGAQTRRPLPVGKVERSVAPLPLGRGRRRLRRRVRGRRSSPIPRQRISRS
jgi:hypothetical protein